MLTLGIDPGTTNLGFGLVAGDADPLLVEFGCLVTSRKADRPRRLLEIYEYIGEILDRHPVTDVAIEQVVFGRNVSTATPVAQAAGVAMVAAARRDLPVAEYSPPQIKAAVTGNGNATKQQVQRLVSLILRLDEAPRPDHAADALATAICHIHNHRLRAILAGAR